MLITAITNVNEWLNNVPLLLSVTLYYIHIGYMGFCPLFELYFSPVKF
jgi:hypothetical protein